MTKTDLVMRKHNGKTINQRKKDGYIHATKMCEAYKKNWHDYARSKRGTAMIRRISDIVWDRSDVNAVETHHGKLQGPAGTWVHPALAYDVACWCSNKFAVTVQSWLPKTCKKLINTEVIPLQNKLTAKKVVVDTKALSKQVSDCEDALLMLASMEKVIGVVKDLQNRMDILETRQDALIADLFANDEAANTAVVTPAHVANHSLDDHSVHHNTQHQPLKVMDEATLHDVHDDTNLTSDEDPSLNMLLDNTGSGALFEPITSPKDLAEEELSAWLTEMVDWLVNYWDSEQEFIYTVIYEDYSETFAWNWRTNRRAFKSFFNRQDLSAKQMFIYTRRIRDLCVLVYQRYSSGIIRPAWNGHYTKLGRSVDILPINGLTPGLFLTPGGKFKACCAHTAAHAAKALTEHAKEVIDNLHNHTQPKLASEEFAKEEDSVTAIADNLHTALDQQLHVHEEHWHDTMPHNHSETGHPIA